MRSKTARNGVGSLAAGTLSPINLAIAFDNSATLRSFR